MSDRLPSLRALRAFEAVARTGGVRRAAEELHVTHSAVSHQVRTLESELGAELLHRQGRSVSLTDAGAALYPALAEAFGRIAEGVARVRTRSGAVTVVLHVYTIAALRWLNERLPDFQRLHPGIVLTYNHRDPTWDFDPATADLGLVLERRPMPDSVVRRPLFPGGLFPVCGAGTPALDVLDTGTPVDLLEVHEGDWKRWGEGVGWRQPEAARVLRVDSYLIALEMAAAGQGIAMMNGPFAEADVAGGRVRRAHSSTVHTGDDWVLVVARERAEAPEVRVVHEWLLNEVAALIHDADSTEGRA